MIYVFYGLEEFLINQEIKKIKEDNNIIDYNISNYNLEINCLSEILDDAKTISLFGDNKLIIVDNSYIFTGAKKDNKDNIDELDKYIDSQNENTILIFKVVSEKLDSRKKIVSKLNKKCITKEFNNTSSNNIVRNMFKPYEIEEKLITLFLNRVGNDLYIINNEIEKIKAYKDNDMIISESDIVNLTIKTVDTDIFHLIDNIVSDNKDAALESYYEMLKRGEEPIKIIIMLANQFRLIYQVKELYKRGYRESDIVNILEQKPYPIKKASQRMMNFSSEELLTYLNKLADLDIDIKSGKVDKKIGLELFILGK